MADQDHSPLAKIVGNMGTMILQLPGSLADEADRSGACMSAPCVTGWQENMPCLTDATLEDGRLILSRPTTESGSIQTPWRIDGFGQLMSSSATLMEREAPYQMAIELARGKINQLRGQAADWTTGGLVIPEALTQRIHDATLAFAHALMCEPVDAGAAAQRTLQLAYVAAHDLVHAYIDQVFQIRHQRQPKIDPGVGCRLETTAPEAPLSDAFLQTFNTVTLPFSWQQIEPTARQFQWEAAEKLADWAFTHSIRVIGGPLIDFSGRNIPPWFWEDATDLTRRGQLIGDYVETIVRRFQPRIRTWQITAGSNCAGVLGRRDEELIWLTLKAAEAVRRVNPHLEVIVGLAQPWGDYLAEQDRNKTPFVFADDLLRTGVKLAGLDLEFIMGISPRGSCCRDLLETSRLLDLYALLGVPIQATLGYASSAAVNAQADPDQRVNLGWWRDGYSEAAQADWATAFAGLALAKPFVRGVQWASWSDAQPHFFPNCGVIDTQGSAKPALQALQKLRSEHLR